MRGTRFLLLLAACAAAASASACTRGGTMVTDGGPDLGPVMVDLGPVDGGPTIPDATVDPCMPSGGRIAIGSSCMTTADCNDFCFCNGPELCMGGVCVAGTDPCAMDMLASCATTACLEETDHCFIQPHDDRCTDSDACNGRETCDAHMGCTTGSPPECNDENPCTVDGCDHVTGCTYIPRDLDMDGYRDSRCGGDDCDDDPRDGVNIHPGAMEICDNNRDDNCDGLRDYNDPMCIPTNDVCATARLLPGRGTYSGATRSLHGDYTLSCGGGSYDAVFEFTTDMVYDVRASFAGASGGAISIRPMSACATGPDIRCNADSAAPSALARMLPAGDYAIIVKTTVQDAFSLTLMFSAPTGAPAGDDCTVPVIVTPDGPAGTATFSGLAFDYSPTCGSTSFGTWHDAVYQFTTTATRDVTVTMNSGGFNDIFQVLGAPCGNESAGMRCQSPFSGSDTEFFRSLPAGTYYVIMTSQSTGTGTVTVTTAAPTPIPPTDSCAGVPALPSVTLTAPLGTRGSDTLIGFSSDRTGGSCEFGSDYPDAFYKFTLAVPTPFTAVAHTVGSTGASSVLYMFLRNGSCGGAQVAGACASGSGSPDAVSLSIPMLPAGTYVLQVEQQSPQSNYSITWTFS